VLERAAVSTRAPSPHGFQSRRIGEVHQLDLLMVKVTGSAIQAPHHGLRQTANFDLLRQRFDGAIFPGGHAAQREGGQVRSMLAGLDGNRRFGARQLCAQTV
jgi:hypothetical protein